MRVTVMSNIGNWIETPESTTIARYKYEERARVLTVEFKKGGRYNYYDVPQMIFDGMKAAPSKGHFLATRIKGAYRYARA
jgi:KTSC domain-containing protein